MSFLTRVRGLWRFDGDTEPVKVSRRRFIFMGACAATGALLPKALLTNEWRYLGASISLAPETVATSYDAFFAATIKNYSAALEKNFLSYSPTLTLLMDGSYTPPPGGEWPRIEKGTREWYKARHERKHERNWWHTWT